MLLSASLTLQNLDVLPGPERMIFNRINVLDPKVPNRVHDRGVLRLQNTGDQTLIIQSLKFNGPWKIAGSAPTSIAPGKSADVTIQFTATSAPKFTYNQTAGTSNTTRGGAYIGSLTITTNDPNRPAQIEELAGWWQQQSEHAEEPSLQSVVNLISNYKTNISPGKVPWLQEPNGKKLFGEEVNSAYWTVANPAKNVGVRALASFHSQGFAVNASWFAKSNKAAHTIMTVAANEGQTFLPHLQGQSGTPAAASFSPGSGPFGFRIDKEWSDDRLNLQTAGGHHIRFYPVRDHLGNVLPNTYFLCLDYAVKGGSVSAENFDFQDQVYIVTNVKPAGN